MAHYLVVLLLLSLSALLTASQDLRIQDDQQAYQIGQFCPAAGLQPRSSDFAGTGVILTAFDARATWHFDVATGRRYPISDTAPCGRNCHLSPDGRHMTYFNDATNAHNTMRLDGAERTFVTTNAADVQWWDADTLFAWTPGLSGFLLRDGERQDVAVQDLSSVQPGGQWGLSVTYDGTHFQRSLVPLDASRNRTINLGIDVPYYDNFAWSPQRNALAYVQPRAIEQDVYSGDLYLVDFNLGVPRQMTDLYPLYGVSRIDGISVNDLAWSPLGDRIAFWVISPASGESDGGVTSGTIHVLDVVSGEVTAYCGFTTSTTTPNPPRLIWSPDGSYIAFAADVKDDAHGAFLIALDTHNGVYTILSEGIYGAFGIPDVYLWGRSS